MATKIERIFYFKSNVWYYILIIGAFLLYVYYTLPLSDWIIDDAGISFAFSRNLAEGYGLVSQPGMVPVEGYSNFLWVLLMVPFFVLKIFNPYITSKIVSGFLILCTYFMIYRIFTKIGIKSKLTILIVLFFISVNASLIIWTSSGLENPLYLFFVVLLLYFLCATTFENITNRHIFILSMIVFCISITRPDGIIYLFVFPLYYLSNILLRKQKISKSDLSVLLRYLFPFALCMCLTLLFRYLYFHDVFPNTYYVKGGPSLRNVAGILTLQKNYLLSFQELEQSFSGKYLWITTPVCIIIWAILFILQKIKFEQRIGIIILYLTSVVIYLLLPVDWMGEYRFATPFYVMNAIVLGLFLHDIFLLTSNNGLKRIIILCALIMIYASYRDNHARLTSWYKSKPVNFNTITYRFAYRFNEYAEKLGLNDASLLAPDMGGTLYYSNLKIYDLGGLCNKVIAKNIGKNQKIFYNYIFDKVKPTFIHTHGYFTVRAKFDEDKRFARDYMPISEYEDKIAGKALKRDIMSGDFVRKDAVEGKEDIVKGLSQ